MSQAVLRIMVGSALWLAGAGCGLTAPVSRTAEVGGGTLAVRTFPARAFPAGITCQVYLPAGYGDAGSERYPTVYLLHGRGDSMTAWTGMKREFDRLIAGKALPPFIAIMPDAPSSRRASYYIDSEFTGSTDPALPAGEKVETAFTVDLIKQVDHSYRTRADRSGRVVAGYSMGGYGALRFGLAHPELFRAAIVLSPAVYAPLPPRASSTREFGAFGRGATVFDEEIYAALNYPALLTEFAKRGLRLDVFIAVGDDEHANPDPAEARHDLDYEAHTLYNRVRREPLIRAELRVTDGGHDWSVWEPALLAGLRWILPFLATPNSSDERQTAGGAGER